MSDTGQPRKTRVVACPVCARLSEYSPDNPFRPFCSERCKLIDLGRWAAEEYRVPGPPAGESTDDSTR